MERNDAVEALYHAVQTRPRPEDVAELVLVVLEEHLSRLPHSPRSPQTPSDKATLELAARDSLRRNLWGVSSMAADFARPVGAEQQVRKAAELFAVPAPHSGIAGIAGISAADCLYPEKVEAFLRSISAQLAYSPGLTNFRVDRLNRAARQSAGLSAQLTKKRQYNKRWRLLKRLDAKIARMIRSWQKYDFTRYGKSALAIRLTREDLAQDLPTACFIAYLSARMSMRSVFTAGPQERAFDEVCAVLFRIASGSPTANWWAMAHVHPDPRVLEHLSEENKGKLLGWWFRILNDIAGLLEETWQSMNVDRETMVVQYGNDSSTWNQAASAWNKAREHWIALLHEMGMERLLEDMCPGKVQRLMAADVAAWHRLSGGDVHSDTDVWAALPLPWEVLMGRARCTKATIESVCRKFDVDFAGWIGRKLPARPVPFRPTPELVHGVAVSSPALAETLRRASWFSGKAGSPVPVPVTIARDEHGFALGAAVDDRDHEHDRDP